MNERALREAIAERAKELGGDGVEFILEQRVIAPGWTILRAHWPENALSGVLHGDTLDLLPARALGRIFRELSLDADELAAIASWMYDPLARASVSDAERIDGGVAFTWTGLRGDRSRVRVVLDAHGEAVLDSAQ